MLIPFSEVKAFMKGLGVTITGILHLGAHECEEKSAYNNEGISDSKIYWIEGNTEKVLQNKQKGVQNIYDALILNEEKEVDFYITKNLYNPGNTESSSILPFGVHAQYYPHVQIQAIQKKKTMTLEKCIVENHIPIQNLNFWNLDIQGVELEALLSAGNFIHFADIIYVEVNLQELYKGCSLLPELEKFLRMYGFERIGLKMTEQGWGDAVFLKTVKDVEIQSIPLLESYLVPMTDIFAKCKENWSIQQILSNNSSSPLANLVFKVMKSKIVNNCDPFTNGEYKLFQMLKPLLKTVVDVGARDDTYFIEQSNQTTELYLFEPHPEFYKKLMASIEQKGLDKQYPNLHVLNLGVSDTSTTLAYHEKAQSFVNRWNEEPSKFLPVVRLDSLESLQKTQEISFLKIDTEGYEIDVLRGAENLFEKIKLIQFEYGGTYPHRGVFLKDVINYLQKHNFTYFYYLSNDALVRMDTQNVYEHELYTNILVSKFSL